MAPKKARSSQATKATSTTRSLEAKLAKAEEKATRWKERAKIAQAEVARLTTRNAKLEKKVDKVRSTPRGPAPAPEQGRAASVAAEAPADAGGISQSTTRPDATWTVAQLRAEARSRGLTGMSNKPKAMLVKALS